MRAEAASLTRGLQSEGDPKVAKWALSERSQKANGTSVSAVGDACHDCYQGWQQGFKAEHSEWSAFVSAYKRDASSKSRIDVALRVLRGEEEAAFPVEEVKQQHSVGIEIQRHMVCLSSAELRSALGASRLLESHTRELKSVSVASETNPSERETLYLFADPSRPYRSAIARASFDISSQGMLQDKAHSCYNGQGSFVQASAWSNADAGVQPVVTARLPSLAPFLRSQGASSKPKGAKRTGGPAHGDDGTSSDGDGSQHADDEDEGESADALLEGIAAASSAPLDLISPAKRRPPVPLFHGPSAAKATASASSARSALCDGGDARSRTTASSHGQSSEGDEHGDEPGDDDDDGGGSDCDDGRGTLSHVWWLL